ncbi:hypothetical protein LOK49_LG05G03238 [Camellia lanceoleosa]|uniref:Uncharacterized protein n=1 Tax=Camellia lanceoleosa TaxID=1840588 RepID=A0ACC0HLG1_9ERIC|nr:hypothetical protein LOK49_LG05G03238 [Camellia lanceoleosa]
MEHSGSPTRRPEDGTRTNSYSTVTNQQNDQEEGDDAEQSLEEEDILELLLPNDVVEVDSDTPITISSISLLNEEIDKIRDPWQNSLIVKLMGRSSSYTYLMDKLKSIWKPSGTFLGIDLGNHFFLLKFQEMLDLNKVLNEGPWFVGMNFLVIPRWEPDFQPKKANILTTVVWARLHNLPIEYYDHQILRRIGNKLGKVLKIDVHTANGDRGRFALLCVQIDMATPLVAKLLVGSILIKIAYEGINAICFHCGLIGHKASECPNHVQINPPIATLVDRGQTVSTLIKQPTTSIIDSNLSTLIALHDNLFECLRECHIPPLESVPSIPSSFEAPNLSLDVPPVTTQFVALTYNPHVLRLHTLLPCSILTSSNMPLETISPPLSSIITSSSPIAQSPPKPHHVPSNFSPTNPSPQCSQPNKSPPNTSYPLPIDQCERSATNQLVHGDHKRVLQSGRPTDQNAPTRPNPCTGMVQSRDNEHLDESCSISTTTSSSATSPDDDRQLPIHPIHPCNRLPSSTDSDEPSGHAQVGTTTNRSAGIGITNGGHISPCATLTNNRSTTTNLNSMGDYSLGSSQ